MNNPNLAYNKFAQYLAIFNYIKVEQTLIYNITFTMFMKHFFMLKPATMPIKASGSTWGSEGGDPIPSSLTFSWGRFFLGC